MKFVSAGTLGDRQIRVVASDATPDRDGDILVPEGCRLEAYQRNNILLADHSPTSPIGTANIELRNNRLEALLNFAPAGISQKADEYLGLFKAGVLSGVSVGFLPIKAAPLKGGGWRYDEWELLELSAVAVPSNSRAVVIERSAMSRNTTMAPAESELQALTRAAALAPTPAHAAAANRALIEFREREAFEAIKPDPDALRAKRLEELAALRPCP
jgi:HK97 family phage prohead protease